MPSCSSMMGAAIIGRSPRRVRWQLTNSILPALRARRGGKRSPLHRRCHETLSQRGPIQRQATRRAAEHARSRNEYLPAIARDNDAGGKLHRPEGGGRSSASFQGGDFEGSKNLDPEKIRWGVNFPSGGIARICVGRHSGIDAHSDTWRQRAGADVPHG